MIYQMRPRASRPERRPIRCRASRRSLAVVPRRPGGKFRSRQRRSSLGRFYRTNIWYMPK